MIGSLRAISARGAQIALAARRQLLRRDDYPDDAASENKRRNLALRLIKLCNAVHICGDQHLASVVQHGIDEHGDGPWGFCVPAAANFYPRKWWPKGAKSPLGEHRDGFGNRVTVHAVANPKKSGKGELHDGMPGFGIVRFVKKDKKVIFECWPRYDGPQYEGWPVEVSLK